MSIPGFTDSDYYTDGKIWACIRVKMDDGITGVGEATLPKKPETIEIEDEDIRFLEVPNSDDELTSISSRITSTARRTATRCGAFFKQDWEGCSFE